ncbi:hypothetical protein ACFL2D_03295 [Patescibacteria group bacterium]
MSEEPTQEILGITEGVLEKMGIKGEVQLSKLDEEDRPAIQILIKTEESRLLIGEHGANLSALQHVLRILVNRNIENQINLHVDINDYRAERKGKLEILAKRAMESSCYTATCYLKTHGCF